MNCPACGGTSGEPALDLGKRRFIRCTTCRALVLDPPLAAAELEGEYGEGYAPFALASGAPGPLTRFRRRWYTARRRRWLRGLRFDSVLDVGCGTGEFLLELRRHADKVHGLEPSGFAAAYAAAQGLEVFHGGVADYRPGRTYDLITLWNVVEHMPDPAGDLARLRDLLAPGGAMVVLTPDAGSLQARRFGRDWAGLEVPRHLQLFDEASLRALAARAGLEQSDRLSARLDHLYIGLASLAAARRRMGLLRSARLLPAVLAGGDSMLVVRLRRA